MLFVLAWALCALYLITLLVILWRQRSAAPFTVRDGLAYLFLVRYPLLSALIGLFLAPLALASFKPLLGNFFVMTSTWEMALATFFVIMAAWSFMYTLLLLLRSAPDVFGVQPVNSPVWLPAWALKSYIWFFALATLPTLCALVINSPTLTWPQWLGGIASGVVAAWLINLGWARLHPLLDQWLGPLKGQLSQWQPFRTLPSTVKEGYNAQQGHFIASGFFSITLLIYLFGFWFCNPNNAWFQPPALVYLCLLLMLGNWLLPALSLFLDRFRASTLLVLVLVSFICWYFGKTDFYYELLPKATVTSSADTALPPEKALKAWVDHHPVNDYPVMVIVTASGGGITSALWTAHVLDTLQEQVGDRFGQSIVLLSSVSGGSVGAMYYAAAFNQSGPPSSAARQKISAAASSPSLAAASWGLIYPDLWRLFFAVPLWNKLHDRGWALEQTWAHRLTDLQTTVDASSAPTITLASWKTDVAAGWRPPVIFNATIVETGEAFWFTPLDLPKTMPNEASDWQIRSFTNLYPGYDVRVTTAARLSATFPYVTPIARPMDKADITKPYHLADGGYYDNHGVVSAIEWLRQVAKQDPSLLRKKILFVQIEDGNFTQDALAEANTKAGWLYGLAGPVVTMLNTRSTAQHLRSNEAIDALSKVYPLSEITHVTFAYGGDGPLSWQLSAAERDEILAGLDPAQCKPQLQEALAAGARTALEATTLSNYCEQNAAALEQVKAIFAANN